MTGNTIATVILALLGALLAAAVTGDIMGAEISLKHWKAHVGREQWR